MSSLLEQAFVDAKALKEAALKNAEATIVEKYSAEVKETLEKILEQDALGLDAAPGDAMGAAPMGTPADGIFVLVMMRAKSLLLKSILMNLPRHFKNLKKT